MGQPFQPWWGQSKKSYQVHRQTFFKTIELLDGTIQYVNLAHADMLCGQPLYRTHSGGGGQPRTVRMPSDDLFGIGPVTCKNCLKALGKYPSDGEEEPAIMSDHDYNKLNHAANLDKLCDYTLSSLARVWEQDKERALHMNRAYATALLKLLSGLQAGVSIEVHELLTKVTFDATQMNYANMESWRTKAGALFERLGSVNQHSITCAMCYSIYLLAGVYPDPNQRPASYAIVEAIRWCDKATVTLESISSVGNLLFD